MPRKSAKKGHLHSELSPEFVKQVCAFIRAGAFPHVACEAAGVPRETFERWMREGCPFGRPRGSQPSKEKLHLWIEVTKAAAQARLKAEMRCFEADPKVWLRSGPGKETRESPGWSRPVSQITVEDNRSVNVLLDPQMQGIFASVLAILAPYPEARAAVAEALQGPAPAPRRERKQIRARASEAEEAGAEESGSEHGGPT